jgi:hypothetical protein
MNQKIREIVEQIVKLEDELKVELEKEEIKVPFKIEKGRIWFDSETFQKQKEALIDLYHYIKSSEILYIVTAPVIYAVIIPAIFLDIFVSVYQAINFRVYKIPLVKRSDYIVFDRQYLGYLNFVEKVNCLYCSYFNGLMAYAGEVAARTEQFWCPIKHAKKIAYRHRYYDKFTAYGDTNYHKKLEALRKELQEKYTG